MAEAARSSGTGPGVITPDGCAVDFYARMPAMGEPAIAHDAIRPGATVLELGCGTGRITGPLVALGHQVVAVDESPEMLAHVRGAETVCARIEDLALGRRFGAVLLASHLINADEATRAVFLAACRSHVADDGAVVVQQYPPAWFDSVAEREGELNGIIVRMRDISRPAPDRVSATVEYQDGARVWTQTFTAFQVDLPVTLASSGLRLDRYLTEDQSWFRALPV